MGLGGEQNTGTTELFVKVDGEQSKEFLDIAKTLENMGAWVERAVNALGVLETKIGSIGKASGKINTNINQGLKSTNVTRLSKNRKSISNIENIPTDDTTSAGKAGLELLRTQRLLVQAQKDLTDAITESTKVTAEAAKTRAQASMKNAQTRYEEEISRSRTRGIWADNMDRSQFVRELKRQFEEEQYLSGAKRRKAEQEEILRDQRIAAGIYSADRRGYNRFTRTEQLKEMLRGSLSRLMHSNALGGFGAKLGTLISPKEVLSKKTSTGTVLTGTGTSIGGLIGGVALQALEKLAKAIFQVGKASLDAYGTMSKLETSLGVVYGSQSQAESVFNEIADYAVKSPFGVEQLTEMAVLLKQSGIYESDLMDTLKIIGDLAGGNEEKYRRIANNYAQVLAIGKATTKDMREFANAGVPIFEATADYLGVSRKSLSSEIEAGNITAQVLEGVFKQLTSEGGIFYNATERNAETYGARLTNLQDTKQLALSALGENLYTGAFFGEYGESSLVKDWLDIFESTFNNIKEWAEEEGLKKAVNATRENSETIEELTEKLNRYLSGEDSISIGGLEELREALEYEKNLFSEDERIRILTASYDAEMQKYQSNVGTTDIVALRSLIDEKETELAGVQAKMFMTFKNSDFYQEVEWEEKSLVEELAKLNLNLEYLEKFFSLQTSDLMYGKTISTLESISRQSADSLNKTQSYNQDSMSNINAYIDELYKETEEYKDAENKARQERIEEAENLSKEFKSYGLANTSEGISFIRGRNFSFEDFQKTVGKFFTGEALFSNSEITQLDVDTAKANAEALRTLDITEQEKEFLTTLIGELGKLQNGHTSDEKTVANFGSFLLRDENKEFQELINAVLYKYVAVDPTDKINAVKALEEQKKKEESNQYIPLWARIAGETFDIAPEKLKWTGFQDKDDPAYNHGYGLETYRTGVYDNPYFNKNNDFRGSMMSRNAVEAILRASGTDYLDKLVFARNSVGSIIRDDHNVAQYDWDQSFKNLQNIALSLTSTQEMSRSLAQFYKDERQKFISYATEGIVAKEDWAKLLDEGYLAKFDLKGEDFERLKNTLSTEYEVLEDGTIKLTHAGMQIALEMEKMLEPMEALTGQFDKLKQSVAGMISANEKTNLQSRAVRTSLFGSEFSNEQQSELAGIAYDVISEELNKLGIDKDERKKYLSRIDYFVNKAKAGETSDNVAENSILEAIRSLLSETQNTSFANIGSALTKSLYNKNDSGQIAGKFSFDLFSAAKNMAFGTINDRGETATQQRILGSLSAEDFSYNEVRDALKSPEYKDIWNEIKQTVKENTNLDVDTLETFDDGMDKILDKWSLLKESASEFDKILNNITNAAAGGLFNFGIEGTVKTLEEIGKHWAMIDKDMGDMSDLATNISDAWKEVGQNLLAQMGPMLVSAGLQSIIFSGGNTGMWLTGLGLIAAGGLSSIFSGYLDNSKSEDKTKEELERLKAVKEQLSDLLAQARIDAEYYEKNLRHQYAISANEELTRQSVNDAIITPKGDIISTHPDDWLIATKTPHDLVGGSAPVVTITIVNESGNTVQVARTEQQRNGNNIDIKAIVVATMNEAVADGSLDSGLAMYQQRQRGKIVSY